MKISDHTFLCSICGREYKYHNHAVYMDPQSELLVMKCPVDGGVAFMVPPGPTIEEQISEIEGEIQSLKKKVQSEISMINLVESGLEGLRIKEEINAKIEKEREKEEPDEDVIKSLERELEDNHRRYSFAMTIAQSEKGEKIDETRSEVERLQLEIQRLEKKRDALASQIGED